MCQSGKGKERKKRKSYAIRAMALMVTFLVCPAKLADAQE
jgi:hypothetical protein